MKRNLKLILFILSLMGPLFGARAYTFTEDFIRGFYWKSFPVSIRVAESDHTEQDRLEGYLQVAMEEWQSDLSVVVWELDYGNSSGNVLRWSDNFAQETGFAEDSTLGVTIRHNRGTYFEKVEIILNRKIAELVQNKGNLLAQTITHELAHTIGLGHTNESGIMYPLIGSFNLPHQDDLEGLQAVVQETLKRQDEGYVAPGSVTSNQAFGCAGSGNSDAASLGGSFFLSLFLGAFPLALFGLIRRR